MDKYTLMASKLTPLQEEWEPKVGDKVNSTHYGGRGIILRVHNDGCITILLDGHEYFDDMKNLIFKPSLEDLIEMYKKTLPECEQKALNIETVILDDISTCILEECPNWLPVLDSIKENVLCIVTHKRWGLVWSDKKKTWEDNNGT
jgi:hypothetical protein